MRCFSIPTARLLFIFALSIFCSQIMAEEASWSMYKRRFFQPEGRIVDTGNNGISHSEGQGFGMLLAVFNDDRETLDKLWQWSNANLYRDDIGLYSWRYDPNSNPHVTDRNTASDGDMLMAWALLLAGNKWQDSRYFEGTDKLQAALVKHTVIDRAGFKIMLPGVDGFNQNNVVTVNPSYFLFPAWQAFHARNQQNVWRELDESAIRMLQKMTFGEFHLNPDWVDMQGDGSVSPGSRWPARFSYDAIRIPLYLGWGHPGSPQLSPFIEWWQKFSREATPAWVDVVSGAKAEYNMAGGLLAVRDFTVWNRGAINPMFGEGDDYYSSTLQLLSWWATKM